MLTARSSSLSLPTGFRSPPHFRISVPITQQQGGEGRGGGRGRRGTRGGEGRAGGGRGGGGEGRAGGGRGGGGGGGGGGGSGGRVRETVEEQVASSRRVTEEAERRAELRELLNSIRPPEVRDTPTTQQLPLTWLCVCVLCF